MLQGRSVLSSSKRKKVEHIDHRPIFEAAFRKLKLTRIEDWYDVTPQRITKEGLAIVRSHYNNSLFEALISIYPQCLWDPLSFKWESRPFWSKIRDYREVAEDVSKKLGLSKFENWYSVQIADLTKLGGFEAKLPKQFSSIYELVSICFPEYYWVPEKFEKYESKDEKLFLSLSSELNIKDHIEWYNITKKDIIERSKSSIQVLNLIEEKYRGSLAIFLSKMIPSQKWEIWKFHKSMISSKEWKMFINQISFLKFCEENLGIKSLDDWYLFKLEDII
jgi:hypothetical protein